MIRGTTAPFKFVVPHDTNTITTIVATFKQKHWTNTNSDPLPIEKWYIRSFDEQLDGVVIRNDGFAFSNTNPKEIQVNLTAGETLRFSDKEKAYVQIRVQFQTEDGIISRASLPEKITVYPVLNDEMIGMPDPSEPVVDGVYIFDAGEIKVGE